MQKKDFNWLQEVVFKSFGKSWDEGQEVQCNMRWGFFSPNNYLFMNVFIDLFDVLIIVVAQQPDGSLLPYI